MVVEGQIAGGVVQGIGGVLYEHVVYDSSDGNPLTTTFVDYLLPTAYRDVPILEYGHIETPSTTPGGFRGMGEGRDCLGRDPRGGALRRPRATRRAGTRAAARAVTSARPHCMREHGPRNDAAPRTSRSTGGPVRRPSTAFGSSIHDERFGTDFSFPNGRIALRLSPRCSQWGFRAPALRLRFTTEVPSWFGLLRSRQPQFPLPGGSFCAGQRPTITNQLLKCPG